MRNETNQTFSPERCGSRPLITVLMPTYNCPQLDQAVESVLAQSYRPIQLVVVDDGSEQFDAQALRELVAGTESGGLKLTLLQNEGNLGTVKALNRGLAAAEGDYVFNLADDDAFFDREVLSDWVACFEETGEDVLTARRANCGATLDTVLSYSPGEEDIRRLKTLPPQEFFEVLARENFISGACTAWRLSRLRELGGYDERYRLIEDYPAYLKLLRQGGRIGFFDRLVIRYRGGGMSAEGSGFSTDYENDYLGIMRQEVLPYVRDPRSVERRLRRWQRDVRFDRWYAAQRKRAEDSALKLGLLKALFFLAHPRLTLRRILVILRGKQP